MWWIIGIVAYVLFVAFVLRFLKVCSQRDKEIREMLDRDTKNH
jgi:bacteriorhodopsin